MQFDAHVRKIRDRASQCALKRREVDARRARLGDTKGRRRRASSVVYFDREAEAPERERFERGC